MDYKNFYLLTDNNVICSHLVSKWIDAFGNLPEFQGIIVKEAPQSLALLKARKDFHERYFPLGYMVGYIQKNPQLYQELAELYPSLDQTEQSMIKNYGVGKYSVTGYDKTIFLGDNLNGTGAKKWLMKVSEKSPPFIFVW